jgi:putative transcriptional regulator
MIQYHPHSELLLAHAAGSLESGPSLLVATHVERCPHCQTRVRDFEAVGGAMLEALEPALLAPEALARTLARIDGPAAAVATSGRAGALRVRAHLPEGLPWPRSMRGCTIKRWRWLGPGMRWSRVTLPHDPAANVFLLRIAAGRSLPAHTHSQTELTQILYGSFHDGRALFGPGDFDEADGSIHHQPVVEPGGECICLASVSGRVMFDGAIARMLGSLVGM